MKCGFSAVLGLFAVFSTLLSPARASEGGVEEVLAFRDGTLDGWTVEVEGTWFVQYAPEFMMNPGDAPVQVCSSHPGGEGMTGMLRSPEFTIDSPYQTFLIAGADGATKRIETSGHYRNVPAWWPWVEGITDVSEVDIQWQ